MAQTSSTPDRGEQQPLKVLRIQQSPTWAKRFPDSNLSQDRETKLRRPHLVFSPSAFLELHRIVSLELQFSESVLIVERSYPRFCYTFFEGEVSRILYPIKSRAKVESK